MPDTERKKGVRRSLDVTLLFSPRVLHPGLSLTSAGKADVEGASEATWHSVHTRSS